MRPLVQLFDDMGCSQTAMTVDNQSLEGNDDEQAGMKRMSIKNMRMKKIRMKMMRMRKRMAKAFV